VQSALDPAGPAAASIARLWWIMLGLTGGAAVAVIALALRAVRDASRGRGTLPPGEPAFLVVGGVLLPAAILAYLLVDTVRRGAAVSRPPGPPAFTVDVVGHQYWWEIRYADGPGPIVTANELHVPVGRTVRVRLTSADVIHSFWVPRLQGKLDMIPGQTNVTWLHAEEAGVHRGQCAEFCGTQHALMALLVIAEPPDAFAAWAAARRRPPREPPGALERRGREVFREARCDGCHAIADVSAPAYVGTVGPDLTHLASRRTLAAATVENTRATLAAFVAAPDRIKPGSRMPATALDPARLEALVAYLETLE
jgi:cytochrome c oxidase subunit 2